MNALLKLLFSVATLALCGYSLNVFGPGPWWTLFILGAALVLVSVAVPRLHLPAVIIAGVMGILSLLGLALLLLAGTVGGSFHLSPSNQVLALGMAAMGILGCACLLLGVRKV